MTQDLTPKMLMSGKILMSSNGKAVNVFTINRFTKYTLNEGSEEPRIVKILLGLFMISCKLTARDPSPTDTYTFAS